MFESIMHAKVAPKKAAVSPQHPFKNEKNHEKLREYIRQRLTLGMPQRDSNIARFSQIDKNIAGWLQLDEEDRKRHIEKIQTGKPSPTTLNIPLTFVHLDDMVTYYAHTFCPSRGMFYHTGKPDEVESASGIVTLMNNHSVYAGWYREVLLTLNALMRYNLGGFGCTWSRDEGPKLEKNQQGDDVLTSEVKWQGNRLESIDMYNLIRDPYVHPTKLHTDGEFAAICKTKSHYWLRNACNQGKYFNCEKALHQDNGVSAFKYYRNPPDEARMNMDASKGGTDYGSWFNEAPEYIQSSGFELVEIYIRLNPTEFGLIDGTAAQQKMRDRYEVWRFTLLNDEWIIDATYMNNIHGYIPLFLGLVNDDLMGTSQKSVGEILSPLQEFASFLLNTHMKATRKNIWGVTVYDPSVVDLGQIPEGEVAAYIPIKSTGYGKDLRNAVWNSGNVLETKQTLGDLQAVMQIIDQFFPTQSLPSQIAGIDRAVDSQVAAVQQGSSRRLHKTARLIDDTLFRWVRFACYYNIIQYQPDNSTVNDFYGRSVTVDLSKLRETDLPFIIGQGLKAIDRQAASQSLERIIFALVQNPQAAAQVNLLDLIDYWVSMIDIDADLKQFKAQTAIDPRTGQPVAIPNGAPPGMEQQAAAPPAQETPVA